MYYITKREHELILALLRKHNDPADAETTKQLIAKMEGTK